MHFVHTHSVVWLLQEKIWCTEMTVATFLHRNTNLYLLHTIHMLCYRNSLCPTYRQLILYETNTIELYIPPLPPYRQDGKAKLIHAKVQHFKKNFPVLLSTLTLCLNFTVTLRDKLLLSFCKETNLHQERRALNNNLEPRKQTKAKRHENLCTHICPLRQQSRVD